jgi:flagellar motility protein MotE (MotC chaperone)
MREEVEELFAKKDTEENARILNLSKVYEKMDPAKAARVIATLETELAVDILANMKQKSAGKILNNLEGEKAATLSVAFSTLQ